MYFQKTKITTANIRPGAKKGESLFEVNGQQVGYYSNKEDEILKNALMGCDTGPFAMIYRPNVGEELPIGVFIKKGEWVYVEIHLEN